MRILALEPYYGGSHKAFLDGWSDRSQHQFTLLTLSASKWKWRMRQSAITFAEQVASRSAKGESWDVIFCSDMLNLAEFLGLSDERIRKLPSIVYFHENQLTYPDRFPGERDMHFGMTNITTCLAATEVWFNSDFHRRSFLDAARAFLSKMPDHRMPEVPGKIKDQSKIFGQGIDEFPRKATRTEGPIRILWSARWEHDKNPEEFFEALRILKNRKIPFRVSVVGQQFERMPSIFESARGEFSDHIDRWGFQPTRADYTKALAESDIFVSTAIHEFFGISAIEAAAAGAFPLLPDRLSYPEIFEKKSPGHEDYFYDGSPSGLAQRLEELSGRVKRGELWNNSGDHRAAAVVARYQWTKMAVKLDDAAEAVIRKFS